MFKENPGAKWNEGVSAVSGQDPTQFTICEKDLKESLSGEGNH
jgi:hypothetical protein